MPGESAQPSEAGRDPSGCQMVFGLLRRTHMSTAADLAQIVADEAGSIGARDVAMYLVDHEQGLLLSPRTSGAPAREPLTVAGTVPGRAFATTTILEAPGEIPGEQRLWLPMLDGTERVGVIGMSFSRSVDEALIEGCERYSHLVAMLAVSKGAYSDIFEVTRRRARMTIASELVQAVSPPLVFATSGLSVAGMLEPAYDNGGDALDYAVNEDILHFAVFDAMGHGL